MRVVSLVGARPQFVKLAPMSVALAEAGVEHKIVHTGQHYDHSMSGTFFDDLGIPPVDVAMGVGSGSHGVQTGSILAGLDPVFSDLSPDWVLVYGDTNSTVAGALSAVKLHIPLAHLEAGLRSHNRRMPEEHNRVLTDHAADLCLAPTDRAVANLAREGLAERTRWVGDVMTDICFKVRDRVVADPIGVPGMQRGDQFVLATVHRAENTDTPARLRALVDRLARLPFPVVLAAHPRLQARAAEFGVPLRSGSIRVVPPLPYPAMVSAILQSHGVVTDSGGLQKEAYLLGRICTTLRTETEWPETVIAGWNVLDPDGDQLPAAVTRAVPTGPRPMPYGDGNAAARVVAAMSETAACGRGSPGRRPGD